jgi:ATP-binding cassette, subfamily B, bacterial
MNDKIISSRKRYLSFIKDNGLFSFNKHTKGYKKAKSLCAVVIRLLKEFKEQRSRLIVVMVVGFVVNIATAIFPWMGKYMIDTIIPQHSTILIIISCAILMIVGTIDVGLNFFRDYTINVLTSSFSVSIKNRIMQHLLKLPLTKIQELKVGGIISRLQQDLDTMSELIFGGIVIPFNAIIMLMIALFSLFLINWKISVLCIIFSFCIGIVDWFIIRSMQSFQKNLREDNSAISTQLTETFSGITVVRSFCQEKTIQSEYGRNIDLLWRKTLYGRMVGVSAKRIIWLINYLMQASIWLFGGYSVINGNMTVGGVVVIIFFIPFIFKPIFNIMVLLPQFQKSLACAERAFELLDEESDIIDSENSTVIKQIKQGLEFHRVTFDYPDGARALKNVSIKIPKGKITALVGPSGGGKTTLINLILRFYKVSSGKITADGIDISELNLLCYRKMLSLVLQEVFLFDSTVKENISFGNRKACQEEIEAVAKIANCHEFIQDLESKYDTFIGEKGVKLSGGQKQRIALARALLTSSQILIFDEATSNLDSESEELIQDALKNILKERTIIISAHRLSTILDADNIIVIEEGNIVEQGNYEELMSKNGRFATMHNAHLGKKGETHN